MKLKKVILVIILIILSLTTSSNAAFVIDKADIYEGDRAKNRLTINGGIIGVQKVFYSYNGKQYPAYCINPDLDGVGEVPGYQVTVQGVLNNPMVWRVLTQGYPYKSIAELGVADEDEAYVATKQAIYCVLRGNDLSRYDSIGDDGRTLEAMKKMVNYARTSNATKPSNNVLIKEKGEWEVDETNTNIRKEFEIITEVPAPEYQISVNNNLENSIKVLDINGKETNKVKQNKFIISIPISRLTKDGQFEISVKANLPTYPVLYGKSPNANWQDYALTGEIYEVGEGKIPAKYHKNETKIKIIKTDENQKRIEGVEFNIIDENEKIIYSNVKTNKDGEVTVEGILPGRYYLEEKSTVNGYEILKEKMQFEVAFNEELILTVENNKIPEQNKRERSYSQKLEKLPVTGK